MSKIIGFVSGPFTEGGYIWSVCEVRHDNNSVEIEEVYYDTFEDAYQDMMELSHGQELDIEDEFLESWEEEEIDEW